MFVLRIKKKVPLKIIHKESGDVLEIHVPDQYKNTGLRVLLNLPDAFKVIHAKQIAGEESYDDDSDNKFNK